MKKNDLRLFLICGVLLLLVALAGCTPAEQGIGETTEQKTQESAELTTQSEITTEERKQTTQTEQKTIETETESIRPVTRPQLTTVGVSEDLAYELADYLQMLFAEYEMKENSFAIRLNYIKRGVRTLHVTFDPSEYYFVGAYYNAPHEQQYPELELFCCSLKYTWVKFENADEIKDSYNGQTLIAAFQINKSLICESFPSATSDSLMEHFQVFKPIFENGINIASPLVYDGSFIYLTLSEKETVYCSKDAYNHDWVAFDCIVRDGQHYVSSILYSEYANGTRYDWDMQYEFGEYYDALMRIMITGQYSETYENGTVSHFGLFKIEDIAKIVLQ